MAVYSKLTTFIVLSSISVSEEEKEAAMSLLYLIHKPTWDHQVHYCLVSFATKGSKIANFQVRCRKVEVIII